jgi:hypothetical protein
MKTKIILISLCLLTIVSNVRSQGYIFDQQSADETFYSESGVFLTNQIVGQSFKPALTSIDFIFLQFYDSDSSFGSGATVYVNLWSGSISNGTPLAATTPVYMPDGFGRSSFGHQGFTNFFFGTSVAVTPGATYFLQPVLQSGDQRWGVLSAFYFGYTGGSLIAGGVSQPSFDLWFREGVIAVPEPSVIYLALLGSGAWLLARRPRAS